MSFAFWLWYLAGNLLCVGAFVDFEPIRFTSPQEPIADWPVLPDGLAGSINGVSAGSVSDGKDNEKAGAFLAARSGLYFYALGSHSIRELVVEALHTSSIAVMCSAGSQLVTFAPSSKSAGSFDAHFLECSDHACQVHASWEVPGVPAACSLPRGNEQKLLVATSRNLIYASLTGERIWTLDGNFTAVASDGENVIAADMERVHKFSLARPPANTTFGVWEWISAAVAGDYAGGVTDGGPITSIAIGADHSTFGSTLLGSHEQIVEVDELFNFRRYGPRRGQPINETQHVAKFGSCCFWAGGDRGLVLRNATSRTWRYFNGPRWLSGQKVLSLSSSDEAVFVVTDKGFSVLLSRERDLAKKAAGYLESYRRHDRHGLLSGCEMNAMGNLKNCTPHTSDNDGLWTSLHVGAAALEYSVTGSKSARDRAWRHFEAMRNQSVITGVPGLPARSICDASEAESCVAAGGTWHNSSVPGWEGWIWKGDTSSDEIVGHFFAYGIMWDVFVDERPQIAELIESVLTNIVSEPYPLSLVDVTGRPTTWAQWQPEKVNLDRDWSDERGLQSLQILSFLLLGFKVTGKQHYLDVFTSLVNDHGYSRNMANCKIEWPEDDNFSDDELNFLPYFTYYSSAKPALEKLDQATLWRFADASLERTFDIVEPERSALWGSIYAACHRYREDGSLREASRRVSADVVWNLQSWPESLVDWPVQNSHRQDVRLYTEAARIGARQRSFEVLRADERNQFRWNANPYELDGGSGRVEVDAGAVLLPYWMARTIPGVLDHGESALLYV